MPGSRVSRCAIATAQGGARAPVREASSLYVVGGLYGNAGADEAHGGSRHAAWRRYPTICFNSDFNWFGVADDRFAEINRRVLAHDAIVGNNGGVRFGGR